MKQSTKYALAGTALLGLSVASASHAIYIITADADDFKEGIERQEKKRDDLGARVDACLYDYRTTKFECASLLSGYRSVSDTVESMREEGQPYNWVGTSLLLVAGISLLTSLAAFDSLYTIRKERKERRKMYPTGNNL